MIDEKNVDVDNKNQIEIEISDNNLNTKELLEKVTDLMRKCSIFKFIWENVWWYLDIDDFKDINTFKKYWHFILQRAYLDMILYRTDTNQVELFNLLLSHSIQNWYIEWINLNSLWYNDYPIIDSIISEWDYKTLEILIKLWVKIGNNWVNLMIWKSNRTKIFNEIHPFLTEDNIQRTIEILVKNWYNITTKYIEDVIVREDVILLSALIKHYKWSKSDFEKLINLVLNWWVNIDKKLTDKKIRESLAVQIISEKKLLLHREMYSILIEHYNKLN